MAPAVTAGGVSITMVEDAAALVPWLVLPSVTLQLMVRLVSTPPLVGSAAVEA